MTNSEHLWNALSEMVSQRGSRSGGYRAGEKRVFGKPDNCVTMKIDTNGVMGEYSVLRLEWCRLNTPTVNFTIHLTEDSLRGKSKMQNPSLDRGGFWWDNNSKWYNWRPDPCLVWERIYEILESCGIENKPLK